jgi:hypothetical protein
MVEVCELSHRSRRVDDVCDSHNYLFRSPQESRMHPAGHSKQFFSSVASLRYAINPNSEIRLAFVLNLR